MEIFDLDEIEKKPEKKKKIQLLSDKEYKKIIHTLMCYSSYQYKYLALVSEISPNIYITDIMLDLFISADEYSGYHNQVIKLFSNRVIPFVDLDKYDIHDTHEHGIEKVWVKNNYLNYIIMLGPLCIILILILVL